MADALRRPWLTALLLGTAATPAAVILAIPAPAPLDAILAWPLVLVDRWMAGSDAGPLGRLAVGLLGIVLTWMYYVLLARLLVQWTARRAPDL
ncbi:MAG TPA: hypothetical protein VFT28_14215 [Gemmatimonadales bacterium]|nr:hypothetical protein [Gemmatimonadales bacterium]